MGQEDELYSNHIPEVLDRCPATIGPSGRWVSLLDGDFGWYRKCSCATGLVFEPMRSHTYGVPTWPVDWPDGWEPFWGLELQMWFEVVLESTHGMSRLMVSRLKCWVDSSGHKIFMTRILSWVDSCYSWVDSLVSRLMNCVSRLNCHETFVQRLFNGWFLNCFEFGNARERKRGFWPWIPPPPTPSPPFLFDFLLPLSPKC